MAMISDNENRNDIVTIRELIADIALPQANESLFNQDFIDTINYTNNKLPKIIGMQSPIYRHIVDLKAEFETLKAQQKEMDKIFVKVKIDVAAIEAGSLRTTFISLTLVLVALLF